MKILMLSDSMDTGGAETHILTLAKELTALGHKIYVASSGGRTAKELRRLGVQHIALQLGSHSPLSAARSYLTLTVFCKRAKIDVIHAHARMPALIGSKISEKLRLPFVTTAHARFVTTPLKKYFSRWGYLSAAVSEDIKQYLCENYGMPADNIRVIGNGIDTKLFAPKRTAERKEMHLVFMSRMDSDCSRAARMLCEIAPMLHEKIPSLRMTLAGGGNALSDVKKLAAEVTKKCGIDIRVCGHVSNVPSLLQSADIFVGVARSALEAMSCGVPTIIAGDEGFFGIVTKSNFSLAHFDNFCARVYAKLTTNKLFDSICRICTLKKGQRLKLGSSLRSEVIKTNSSESMAHETMVMYNDAKKMIPAERGDIVLCGYYGCGNTGDDALLRGAIKRARERYHRLSITSLTARGKVDSYRFGVKCIKRKSPYSVLREIANAKVFVFGGGTLLQDATSKRSLIYYLFLLRYAQRKGVRCELWGNGIGPLRVRVLRPLVARALGGCSYIGVRDARSGSCVRALTKGACVTPIAEADLAASFEPSTNERTSFLLKHIGIDSTQKYVCVAVKGSRLIGKEKREFMRLFKFLQHLSKLDIQLLFIEFFPREDHKITQKLCDAFGGKTVFGLSPSDIVGIFSRADFVCASRFHALVFARAARTPYFAFGNDPKISEIKRLSLYVDNYF